MIPKVVSELRNPNHTGFNSLVARLSLKFADEFQGRDIISLPSLQFVAPRFSLLPPTGRGDLKMESRWGSSLPGRYPDPAVVVMDPRFQRLVVPIAAVERIATGFRFTEGPVWYGDGRYLLFSDIPNDALVRWDEITGAVATLR